VESTEGEGSIFTVIFPVKQKSVKAIDISETLESTKNLKPRILVVEDNPQIRERIREILAADYNIIEAEDGVEGYEKTCYHTPDLIISDLLMPRMDGLELCQRVFTNPVIMGTPLILLSAVSSDDSIIRGYKVGADDYITKPFNPETLKARVKNLIEKRASSKNSIKTGIDAVESTGEKDSVFLNQIKEIVFENITNEDFKIEEVVKKVGMSRSKFYRKVKEITGMSPVNYLRKLKLEYASQVILKSDNTISEVAYHAGFSDVKYFTKCFLKEFKIYPSEYRKKYQ
jgi:DNA-binding response OmpR family regulator